MACLIRCCDALIKATFGVDFMTGRANPIVGFDVLTINRRIDLKDRMMDKTSQTSVEARRSFLKKAAYAAPAIVVLGGLTLPQQAQASLIYQRTVKSTNTNGAQKTTDIFKENDGSGTVVKEITKVKPNGTVVTKTKTITTK